MCLTVADIVVHAGIPHCFSNFLCVFVTQEAEHIPSFGMNIIILCAYLYAILISRLASGILSVLISSCTSDNYFHCLFLLFHCKLVIIFLGIRSPGCLYLLSLIFRLFISGQDNVGCFLCGFCGFEFCKNPFVRSGQFLPQKF